METKLTNYLHPSRGTANYFAKGNRKLRDHFHWKSFPNFWCRSSPSILKKVIDKLRTILIICLTLQYQVAKSPNALRKEKTFSHSFQMRGTYLQMFEPNLQRRDNDNYYKMARRFFMKRSKKWTSEIQFFLPSFSFIAQSSVLSCWKSYSFMSIWYNRKKYPYFHDYFSIREKSRTDTSWNANLYVQQLSNCIQYLQGSRSTSFTHTWSV